MARNTDTKNVNALDLLRTQHEEVESLIEEIEDSDDPGEKANLFAVLADNIAAHSIIEEKLFYPTVVAKQTREMLVEAVEDHLSVKRLVADLLDLDPENEHFDAKLSVLKEQIRHHAHDEEEDKLFPKVKKLLTASELEELGAKMKAMFETALAEEPRMHVPAETAVAAPL
jgi:hemerythrin superfamily protein